MTDPNNLLGPRPLSTPAKKGCSCGACRAERRRHAEAEAEQAADTAAEQEGSTTDQAALGDYG